MATIARSELDIDIRLVPVDDMMRSIEVGPDTPNLPQCETCPGDDEVPVGASKFGGFADIPLEWIEHDSIPRLIFQINFSDFSDDHLSTAKLPGRGILYVFTDSDHYDPAGNAYVRYWPGPLVSPVQLKRMAPTPSDVKWWKSYEGRIKYSSVQLSPASRIEIIPLMETSVNKGYVHCTNSARGQPLSRVLQVPDRRLLRLASRKSAFPRGIFIPSIGLR
jgi:hypothetical protein